MKTSGMIAAILLGVVALTLTVWIGRYDGKPSALGVGPAPSVVADPGPEISKTGPHPKAVAEVTEYDFGTMAQGQKGEHKFIIKNEGEADMKLLARKEDATCQCTLGKLADGDVIPPGESREVTLNWEIKVRVERFRHSAKIRTNDPDNRIIEFVVTGKVDDRFTVTPGEVWELGDLVRGEPTTMKGTVFSTVMEKFNILSAIGSHEKIAVTYEPMTAEALTEKGAKCGYNIQAVVDAGVPVGPFSEKFTLVTDEPTRKEIAIQLHGYLAGPIEFLGPSYTKEASVVSLGEFPADKGNEVTLSLFVRDFDEDLQLLDVVPKSERIQFELKKDERLTGKTKRYQLKIKALPGPPGTFVRDAQFKFELKFNHPHAPSVGLSIRMLAL